MCTSIQLRLMRNACNYEGSFQHASSHAYIHSCTCSLYMHIHTYMYMFIVHAYTHVYTCTCSLYMCIHIHVDVAHYSKQEDVTIRMYIFMHRMEQNKKFSCSCFSLLFKKTRIVQITLGAHNTASQHIPLNISAHGNTPPPPPHTH